MKERFEFMSSTKKSLMFLLIAGILLSILGTYQIISADHAHSYDDPTHSIESSSYEDNYPIDENYHPPFKWYQRLYSNLY